MLIVSIALCFLMVLLATEANFSAALGAFIMGSILAETEEGERIEHLLISVKDLFAAVFFVSVGMMIDPKILQEHFGVVVLITIITIVGKLLGSGFGAILSGRSLKHSTQAGMSLAQIGEFSFIIATLGVSLKVVSDFLYPIIIAVSAVTTFTTPYMIRYSGPIYAWIEKRLPKTFLDRMSQYERAMSSPGKESAFGLLWRTYGLSVLLNSVVVLGIGLSAAAWGLPLVLQTFGDSATARILACVLTLVVCSPFLAAVIFKIPKKVSTAEAEAILRLRRLQLGVTVIRGVVGLILIEVVINQFAKSSVLPVITLVVTPLCIYIFRIQIGRFYSVIEERFLKNLNAKEILEMESLAKLPLLAPWNVNLVQVVVTSDSRLAGQTLEESKFRSTTGATIGMIDRGSRRLFAPSRSERLLPGDELFLIGTDEQIGAARELIHPKVPKASLEHDELYSLDSIHIDENSPYAKKSIREAGFGEHFGGLVVGIERSGSRILNPESSMQIEPQDLVWIFGHQEKIRALKTSS